MELWHPRAFRAPANKASGPFIDVPPKIVLHTVEGKGTYSYNPASYYGNPYWPHSTIDGVGIHQHLPIDVYGFALANAAGGVETNRAYAIQCEILWFSAEIADLPDDVLANVADWVGWVAERTGAPILFAEFSGTNAAGENAPQRFDGLEWLDFTGICGHQHVPENDHWDPGAFPVDRLRALLNHQPSIKELPMRFTYIADGEDFVYLTEERFHGRLPFGDFLDAIKGQKAVENWGKQSSEFHAGVSALAEQCGFAGSRD